MNIDISGSIPVSLIGQLSGSRAMPGLAYTVILTLGNTGLLSTALCSIYMYSTVITEKICYKHTFIGD